MDVEHNNIEDVLWKKEGLTEKQRKILKAATEAFAEKGYAATSTSEIAKKAGVAEGTIFRHYKTKKDLLLTIVSPMMVTLISPMVIKEINKVLDQQFEDFEDFLRAMIKNREQFIVNNKEVIRILLQEIPFHAELKEQFIEKIGKKVYPRLTHIVRHYQEKGQIIDMPTDTIIRLVGSTLIGFFVTKYVISPEDWDNEEEIDRMILFLKNGLAPKEGN